MLGVRQVVVTCCRSTSVVRSLKLLTLPHSKEHQELTTIVLTSTDCLTIIPAYSNRYP